MLVHDDVAAAAPVLSAASSVVWVLDNCGLELLVDLAAVAWFLARGRTVTLHCKVSRAHAAMPPRPAAAPSAAPSPPGSTAHTPLVAVSPPLLRSPTLSS